MKTVRPLGLVIVALSAIFLLGGCHAIFGSNLTSVEFRENGVPTSLTRNEYGAIRKDLKNLLDERELTLATISFQAPFITVVDLKTMPTSTGRNVVGLKIAAVMRNPKVLSRDRFSADNNSAHPSLSLAHALDQVRNPGDTR
jgi:hypothetical protein